MPDRDPTQSELQEARKASAARMERWQELEGRRETMAACGAWTIRPIGLEGLGAMADHPDGFTAIHEAGHTVAFHVLGQTPDKVTIEPDRDKGILGYALPSEGDDMTEEGIRGLVVSNLAGECAALLAGEDAEIAAGGAVSDQEEAEFRLHQLYFGTEDEKVPALADLRAETETLLRSHWWRVGVVARLLLKHRTLDWEELSSALEADNERDAESAFEVVSAAMARFKGARSKEKRE